ncbi:hypothetical protein [uncultured Clostridium sp.]|uniref:hypothetical protein n=1 Tax=uncultured Clostridium sp. TaxID=59620 RepID=UPI0025D083EA|nr:hypothetical protein [uncultured Clostridium sp.]
MEKELVLKGQSYKGRIDFKTLGMVQANLKKQGQKVGFQEIFQGVSEQDFSIITELVIQSILRCHPQISRKSLEEKLDLTEIENVFTFLAELLQDSLPSDKKGK